MLLRLCYYPAMITINCSSKRIEKYGKFYVAAVPAFARNGCSTAVYRPSAIPHFTASQRCPGEGSAEMKYDCDLLNDMGLKPLDAPPGGRAYRETWSGPFSQITGHGSITLTIAADGQRTLEAPWLTRPYHLPPNELPDFEATLAKSRFDKWTVYNRMGRDNGHGAVESVCIDGVVTSIEAIVDGQYRIVLFDFCGGVFDEQIAQALDQLFVFTANLKHLKYPVNADHPTFRGY